MITLGVTNTQEKDADYIIGTARGHFLDAFVKIVKAINSRGENLTRLQELEIHHAILDSHKHHRKVTVGTVTSTGYFWICVNDEIQ